ncbi:hypothetical protein EW146_g5585 [Bondarzewia mesenterica]|uniref:Uncharacterized protein n=1 Tax=Bondarzewia mesenterica TaxID=1095465 RepID=A0A4S4LR13_9AGAM|nr:hypothetical protein EW146_g5585 [Bondarzewia mesenterica]
MIHQSEAGARLLLLTELRYSTSHKVLSEFQSLWNTAESLPWPTSKATPIDGDDKIRDSVDHMSDSGREQGSDSAMPQRAAETRREIDQMPVPHRRFTLSALAPSDRDAISGAVWEHHTVVREHFGPPTSREGSWEAKNIHPEIEESAYSVEPGWQLLP